MDPVGPGWRFSFPWEDWDTPSPEVGADLQLTLSDGRTTTAIVERVQVEIELTDAWIYLRWHGAHTIPNGSGRRLTSA